MKRLSEEWWAERGPHVVRCKAHRKNGDRCKHVAIDGAVVCRYHGGAAPAVKARAAQRIIMAADDAASKLVAWMNDDNVPIKERRLIASDLLDRANLAGKQMAEVEVKHQWETLMGEVVDFEVVTDYSLSDGDADEGIDTDSQYVVMPSPERPALPPPPAQEEWRAEPVEIVEAEIVNDEPPDHLREEVRGDGNRYRR